MDTPSNPATAAPTRGSSGIPRPVLWGCGGLLVLALCGCIVFSVASVGLLSYLGGAPEGLRVDYALPEHVQEGEEFELVLKLSNTSNADLFVGDIDLDEAFGGSILDGAMVMETIPHMERDYSISGIKTFKYERVLPAGSSQQVVFKLQATTAGEYGGSVGVYVGSLATRINTVTITVARP